MKKEMLDKDIQELKQLVYDLYKYADKGVLAGIATQSVQERILRIETQLSETEEKLKEAYEFILKNCPEMEIVSDGFTDCVPAIETNMIRDEAQNWLQNKE